MTLRLFRPALLSLLCAAAMTAPSAGATALYELVIEEHRFSPELLEIPANSKIKLLIDNRDPSAEEFESFELNREKVILGHSKTVIYIGPLAVGDYRYFGEFNPATAQGVIRAVDGYSGGTP
jgi:hypothetical protein